MGKDEKLLREILDEANFSSKRESKILEKRRELQKRALAPIEYEIKNIAKLIAQGNSSPALEKKFERLEIQKKQIEEELEKIEMEFQELKNRTINAEFVKEGLSFFERVWQDAPLKQKKRPL